MSGIRHILRKARRSIAPADSKREAVLRSIYVPIALRFTKPPIPKLPDPAGMLTRRYLSLYERARQLPAKPRIALLALAHLGDFLVSLRGFERIRDSFPGAHLTIICGPWCVEWAKKADLFDEIIPFKFFTELNKDWKGVNRDLLDRFSALELGPFDIAIDFRHDQDTRPCLYRIAAAFRVGFAAPVEEGLPHLDLMLPGLEDIRVPGSTKRKPWHAEQRLIALADAVVATFSEPVLHPVRRLLGLMDSHAHRQRAIISLGAGDPIRKWPLDHFVEVARQLVERHGCEIMVIGGELEQADATSLLSHLPSDSVIGRTDFTLTELPDLIAAASLVIGHGTGVLHLAAMLGIPTIVLLSGVTAADVWYPKGKKTVVLTKRVACSPCGFRRAEECRFDGRCLTSIMPEDVLKCAEELLRGE